MTNARSQHVVPQVYLREFTDPECAPGHTPFIWIREKGALEWKRRAPKNIACENNFYTLTDQAAGDPMQLERAFSSAESDVGPVLRKLKREEKLEWVDEERLAYFIALLKRRVYSHREQVTERLYKDGAVQMQELVRFYKRFPAVFASQAAAYDGVHGTKIGKRGVKSFIKHLPKMVPTQVGVFNAMFRNLEAFALQILAMQWQFKVSNQSDFFVTSDDPVLLLGQSSHDFDQVVVPLGRNLALFAKKGENSRGYYTARRSHVEDFNRRVSGFATRFVVAPRPGFVGEMTAN